MVGGKLFNNNPGEFSFALLGAKDTLLIGVGMVAEKIRTNPEYRMWATVVGMLIALLIPIGGTMAWMHSQMEKQIDLRIDPMKHDIVEIRKNDDRTIELIDLKLEPVKVQVDGILKGQVSEIIVYSKEDALRDIDMIFDFIKDNKEENRVCHSDIKARISRLEQKTIKYNNE